MKPIILAALLLAGIPPAFGNPSETADSDKAKHDERAMQCVFKADVFREAAMYRDINTRPENAFKNLRHGYPTLDEGFIKNAINNVYFNRDFAYAGGQSLTQQIFNLCMNGPNNWKPLK